MRKAKAIHIQLAVARRSATVICSLAETQRLAGEWEGFIMEWRERFKCAVSGGCWPGEAVGRLARQKGTSCDWLVRGTYLTFSLVGPKLKEGTKINKAVILNQDLAILAQLLQSLSFGFLDCH